MIWFTLIIKFVYAAADESFVLLLESNYNCWKKKNKKIISRTNCNDVYTNNYSILMIKLEF
jgi:hypothetical protein